MIAAPGRIFTQCPSKHNAALGMRPEHRHMEKQPRHAAAQVTLLEASFVFLPGLRRGENPSIEQHRQAPKCCCRFARSSSSAAERQRSGSGAAERRAAAAAERRAATAAERRAATAAERSSAGTDNGLWLTVANGGLSALAMVKSPPQPAAAATSRQQQRRAASGSSNGEQPCASSHIKL